MTTQFYIRIHILCHIHESIYSIHEGYKLKVTPIVDAIEIQERSNIDTKTIVKAGAQTTMASIVSTSSRSQNSGKIKNATNDHDPDTTIIRM